ncbi:MAG: hypothetical protein U0136_13115 [Bdellovibrionota bacterium]
MRPIQYSANSDASVVGGFAILELVVAMVLFAIVGTIVTKALVFHSDTYLEDVLRMRIQQNVRGALDIMAMNIRQAGEGFDKLFPAVTLADSTTPGDSVLTMRRKTLSEVLAVCQPLVMHTDTIIVSDPTSTTPECLPSNVAPGIQAWHTERMKQQGATLRVFVYDRVGKIGEFLEFNGEGQAPDGSDYLLVSQPAASYPARSSSVYVIEEFSFALDSATDTLKLTINGLTDSPEDVAYRISAFQARIHMQDGTTVSTLAPTDTNSWKNIRSVELTLSGQDSWRTRSMTRAVKGDYFPRNILSR